jgi:predicted esterase
MDANPTALKILFDGIREKRVLVEPGLFDLFLPPGATTSSNKTSTFLRAGFIFFPGALVEYRAYTGVAKKLSTQGILVVLFNTEHFHRLPLEIFDCNMESIQKAISLIDTKYSLQCQEWSIGGHSMGSFTSQQIVLKHPGFFQSIVLLGTYRPLLIEDSDIDILVVQATRDGMGEPYRQGPQRQQFLDSFAKLKQRKSLHDIKGGNHGGFGDYATQTFPAMDNERTVSLEAMHSELVKVTADFLLQRS